MRAVLAPQYDALSPEVFSKLALESIFYLLGGESSGFKPYYVSEKGHVRHFLKQPLTMQIVDPLQDHGHVSYNDGKSYGWSSKGNKDAPNAKAVEVIDTIIRHGAINDLLIEHGFHDHLGKSIAQLPVGEKVAEVPSFSGIKTEKWNYTHLLSHNNQFDGYKLHVEHYKRPDGSTHLSAILNNSNAKSKKYLGMLTAELKDGHVSIDTARVDELHRERGLGLSMYESVLGHAKNMLGATHASGMEHSSMAHRVHQKLAEKHKLGYKAKPNYGNMTNNWETREEWEKAKNGPFDAKWGNYEYKLKSEDGKSEIDNWLDLRKAERDSRSRIASVAVFNKKGELLFGKRRDNGRQTLPGGHLKVGESELEGAVRELYEEAGIKPKSIEYIGDGWAGASDKLHIYCYRAITEVDKVTGSKDPDEECEEWEWVDVSNGLPVAIADNLHAKKNITLRLLGLQEGEMMELSKGLKDKFVALAVAATTSFAPATTLGNNQPNNQPSHTIIDHTTKWTPNGLHKELHPIAQLESSFGRNTTHARHSKGEFHTAHGAVGLKPVTAHEQYKRTPALQKLFPDLHDEGKFTKELKSNHAFYNAVASAHWSHLKKMFGTPEDAAFAWRWGPSKAAKTPRELRAADPYVIGYKNMYSKIAPMENPLK